MRSGIIILNKPTNISSNGAVSKIKKLLNAKKVGHLGTLDPLASGVLPITIGKATRLFEYFLNKNKTYKAIFSFDFETSTLDCEGEIVNFKDKKISIDEINEVLKTFVGKIEQLPPLYSAKKINGQKAYDLARQGKQFELKSKQIEIYAISVKQINEAEKLEAKRFFIENNKDKQLNQKLNNIKFNNLFEFEINCSSGTYIRSLCRDIANKLNAFGTMLKLTRTKCGEFDLKNSVDFDEIDASKILNMQDYINLPSVEIDNQTKIDLINGKKIEFDTNNEDFKLFCNNKFLGIVNSKNGILKIKTFLLEE